MYHPSLHLLTYTENIFLILIKMVRHYQVYPASRPRRGEHFDSVLNLLSICSTQIGAKLSLEELLVEKVLCFYLYRYRQIFNLLHCPLFFSGSSIKIDIRSEGCNDPGKTPNTCGIAYIKVNDNEHSKKKRGHNVVVLDAVTGKGLKWCYFLSPNNIEKMKFEKNRLQMSSYRNLFLQRVK